MGVWRMGPKVLIVEDQCLIAYAMESIITDLGFECCGIARRKAEALELGVGAEIAFVDVNLTNGPTGPEIGEHLARCGTKVVFMTGNPEMIAGGITGTIGVLAKPVIDEDIKGVLRFLENGVSASPPRSMQVFSH